MSFPIAMQKLLIAAQWREKTIPIFTIQFNLGRSALELGSARMGVKAGHHEPLVRARSRLHPKMRLAFQLDAEMGDISGDVILPGVLGSRRRFLRPFNGVMDRIGPSAFLILHHGVLFTTCAIHSPRHSYYFRDA